MSKSYFKYLFNSNKVLISFIFIVQFLICLIENLTVALYNDEILVYSGNLFFCYALVFVLPILLLHYVQDKKSVDSYFALPVKRRSIIVTTLLFAWLLVLVPLTLILVGYSFVDMANVGTYLIVILASALSFIVFLIFNSGVYLIGNNNVDGIIMMIAYSLIPFIFIGLVSNFFDIICYGFTLDIFQYCRYVSLIYSSYSYLNNVNVTSYLISWLITIVVYFVAGYIAIRKHYINRKVERAQTISDGFFAYPFVIYTSLIMLLFMVSFSFARSYNQIGDLALFYFLVAILFEILTFVYRRMIKVKIRDILIIVLTILISIGFVKISLHLEGYNISYMYDHNPNNVIYNYNMWNVQDEELLDLLQEKYGEVNYCYIYFDLKIAEKDMDKYKEANKWFNELRDKSIKNYFHSDNIVYNNSLQVKNNCKEVNGVISDEHNENEVYYYYNDIALSFDELKYINDNFATVYVEIETVVKMQDVTSEDTDGSGKELLTQSTETLDYLVLTLDDILDK